jgi:type IV pilus assembly protein PilM
LTSAAVGLDLGSTSLKVVHLEGNPSTLRLRGCAVGPCPEGLIANGSVTDHQALGAALRALFEDNDIGPRRVVFALKGPGLFVRRLSLPSVGEEELAELVTWELEQVLPWEMEETQFDYLVQEPGGGEEPQDVLVSAVRREVLMGYRQALAEADLEPLSVDHVSFALENTFHLCFEADPQRVVALLDLGASVSTVHLLKGERTLAVRDELIGGRAVVDHVASRCSASADEVELFLEGKRPEALEHATAEVALQEAAEGVADRLLKAINSLGYGPGETPIDYTVLGGGLSRVSTVERCVGEAFGAPTELLNPFLGVEYDEELWSHDQLQELAPSAAVVVGLALRAMRESS